jgi:hypothetical protein
MLGGISLHSFLQKQAEQRPRDLPVGLQRRFVGLVIVTRSIVRYA